VRPALLEATAFGAFRMSLLGAGACDDPRQLPALTGERTVVLPTLPPEHVQRLRARWRDAVQRSRGWA
jgi:glycerol kinase